MSHFCRISKDPFLSFEMHDPFPPRSAHLIPPHFRICFVLLLRLPPPLPLRNANRSALVLPSVAKILDAYFTTWLPAQPLSCIGSGVPHCPCQAAVSLFLLDSDISAFLNKGDLSVRILYFCRHPLFPRDLCPRFSHRAPSRKVLPPPKSWKTDVLFPVLRNVDAANNSPFLTYRPPPFFFSYPPLRF